MSIMFQYDQTAAVTAGESSYINQSGAYTGKITAAKWTRGQHTQSQALELSFESADGQKANYISIYHTKADGSPNQYGIAHINAIMGLLNLQNLTTAPQGSDHICPELVGKSIGLILQKVLTTKTDGSDSYKFELVLAFSTRSRLTLKEHLEGGPAERVDKILATLKDKDERKQQSGAGHQVPPPPSRQSAQTVQPREDIDDDIPF
ncbi:hypothetical protein [Bergeriella denitrificans]|uniref:Uncharacterized protein n=1 Tax=Bergeriella denitrificans TaxID=494 RepID=A0A378UL48_BERDE|nr:hypothetical protein [Bergeriella denitrificans]STZ77379.1 Uncharacterised protein [Bergeriella denitrificans]STZ82998.1 Uncharacterised protein [Bergeriella denitrificans]